MKGVGISGTKSGSYRFHFKCNTLSNVLKSHNLIVHQTRKRNSRVQQVQRKETWRDWAILSRESAEDTEWIINTEWIIPLQMAWLASSKSYFRNLLSASCTVSLAKLSLYECLVSFPAQSITTLLLIRKGVPAFLPSSESIVCFENWTTSLKLLRSFYRANESESYLLIHKWEDIKHSQGQNWTG